MEVAMKMHVDNLNFDAEIVEEPSPHDLEEAEKEAREVEEEYEATINRSERWLARLGRHELLSREETNRLTLLAQKKPPDIAARNKIIRHNLRFVFKLAFRYARFCKHLSVDDLVQEGSLGLVRAVEGFEPARGWRFITYATHWVRQNIQRAITNKESCIRLPVHMREKIGRLKRLGKVSESEADAASGRAGFSPAQVQLVRSAQALRVFSFDTPIGDSEGRTFLDIMASADGSLDHGVHLQEIVTALAVIPVRERKVFLARLFEETTLKTIGKAVKRSRERIRQIEAEAARLMRLALQRPRQERPPFPAALRIVQTDIAELFPKRKKGAPALAALVPEFPPRWVRSAAPRKAPKRLSKKTGT